MGAEWLGRAGEAAFLAGFLALWFGFVCFFLAVLLQKGVIGAWWRSLALPWRDRIATQSRVMHEIIAQVPKTRGGRASQVLLALGSGILILNGLVWLIPKIALKSAG